MYNRMMRRIFLNWIVKDVNSFNAVGTSYKLADKSQNSKVLSGRIYGLKNILISNWSVFTVKIFPEL
jgi:hypothetical protein